jgi:PKD repeat protein
MIKRFKLAVLATAIGVILNSAQAQTLYNNDLLIGFTTQSGNDVIYDLGAESSLTNNQTWNLHSLLSGYNLNIVYWGVIGAFQNNGGTGKNYDDVWSTTAGSPPPKINGLTAFANENTAIGTIYQFMPAAGAGNSFTISATDDNSWNQQTISGSGPSQYISVYGNPNVVGPTSDSLYQIVANNTAPTLVGHFTLASSGVVTFSTGSAAPVAGFTGIPTAGFAPLQVVLTNISTGSFTNSLWNLGDGHSVTNSAASAAGNVTNTYAAEGKYTVTLAVTGSGGASTNVQTSYIVVSPVPTIGNVTVLGGQLVFSGTNCPAGVQYRILTSTNVALPLSSWTPVVTNTFPGNGSYSYTNSTGKSAAFFRLVSP